VLTLAQLWIDLPYYLTAIFCKLHILGCSEPRGDSLRRLEGQVCCSCSKERLSLNLGILKEAEPITVHLGEGRTPQLWIWAFEGGSHPYFCKAEEI
jgi:hypothetical protein